MAKITDLLSAHMDALGAYAVVALDDGRYAFTWGPYPPQVGEEVPQWEESTPDLGAFTGDWGETRRAAENCARGVEQVNPERGLDLREWITALPSDPPGGEAQ